MNVAFDELPGRTVLDSTGRVVGEVARVMVDTETWAVSTLRVKLRKGVAEVLGLDNSVFRQHTLDVPTGLVFAASDAIILRAGIDELQGLVASHGHGSSEWAAAE